MSDRVGDLVAMTIIIGSVFFVISIVFTEVLGDTKALIIGITGAACMIFSAIVFHAMYIKGDLR